MKSKDCESLVLNFFDLLQEIPSVKIVRIDIPKLTISTFTSILVEQFERENISEVLEFRVDKFTTKVDQPKIFEQSVLGEMYKVSKHSCRTVTNV